MLQQVQEAVGYLREQTDFQPELGIILGTGLGALLKDVDAQCTIPYDDIPHFPIATVEFHHGKLIFGELEGKKTVIMQGRFHYYEGYSMKQVTFPVRVMKMLGIKHLFISNASGGIRKDFELGDIMPLTDHINLLPENPLTGPNEEQLGPRFPDMFEPYDRELLTRAQAITKEHQLPAKPGVYASVPGPNLETPAEYKYLEVIGADAVGMSTVPEVIVAKHMSIPVFACSVITDLCYPEALKPVNIEEIIATAANAEPHLKKLFLELIKTL